MAKEKTRIPSKWTTSNPFDKNAETGTQRSSILTQDKILGSLMFINIENIFPSKYQIRSVFDSTGLDELAESMKGEANLEPLWVSPLKDENSELISGKYECLSGERRLRAAKLAGLTKLKCLIENDEEKAKKLAFGSNFNRRDLSFIEVAIGISQKKKDGVLKDVADIINVTGLSRSQVYKYIQMGELSETLIKFIQKNNLNQSFIEKHILTKPDILITELEKLVEEQNNSKLKDSKESLKVKTTTKKDGFINPFVFTKNKLTRIKNHFEEAPQEDIEQAIKNLEILLDILKRNDN